MWSTAVKSSPVVRRTKNEAITSVYSARRTKNEIVISTGVYSSAFACWTKRFAGQNPLFIGFSVGINSFAVGRAIRKEALCGLVDH